MKRKEPETKQVAMRLEGDVMRVMEEVAKRANVSRTTVVNVLLALHVVARS